MSDADELAEAGRQIERREFAFQVAEMVIQSLKDERLVRDDRPPLTLDQAAVRLGVSRRVLGDLIAVVPGRAPYLMTIKMIPGSNKGVMVEARELERFLEWRRRETLAAATRSDRRSPPSSWT